MTGLREALIRLLPVLTPGAMERALLAKLQAQEQVEALCVGALKEYAWAANAALACTDRRVAVYVKRWFGYELVTLHYENITGVDEIATLRQQAIAIRAVAGSIVFYPRCALKRDRERAEACIARLRARTGKLTAAALPPSLPAPADRLREARKLLDEGLITAEEYEAKKQEIMQAL